MDRRQHRWVNEIEPPDVGGHPAVHVGQGFRRPCRGAHWSGRSFPLERTRVPLQGGNPGFIHINCSINWTEITLKRKWRTQGRALQAHFPLLRALSLKELLPEGDLLLGVRS